MQGMVGKAAVRAEKAHLQGRASKRLMQGMVDGRVAHARAALLGDSRARESVANCHLDICCINWWHDQPPDKPFDQLQIRPEGRACMTCCLPSRPISRKSSPGD
eukprot:363885-Chlamydomonas_euryale.AAC.20